MTFSVTLYNSYRRAGILKEAGRGISASQTTDGLSAFNSMVDLWRGQRLTVWAESRQEFAITSGQGDYTIGLDPSADWQVQMPTDIEKAGYVFTTTSPPVEEPFSIYTPQLWQALSPKTLQSTNPYVLYYESSTVAGRVSTMGTVHLWPVPIDETIAVALYPWMQLHSITDPTAVVIFPPTYQETVESNLAIRLAAMFPKDAALSPLTIEIARSSLAKMKASNSKPLIMRVDRGMLSNGGGTFNLLSNAFNNKF